MMIAAIITDCTINEFSKKKKKKTPSRYILYSLIDQGILVPLLQVKQKINQ